MKSPVVKRSIILNGHKTSISIEDPFWSEMKAIAAERRMTLAQLVSMVDHDRAGVGNLSSALRLFVLARYLPPAKVAGQQPDHPEQPATAARAAVIHGGALRREDV